MAFEAEWKVQIKGAKELRKIAKDVAGKEGQAALRKANKDAGLIVADEAKNSAVPVKSGDLQASIKPASTIKSALVRAGGTKAVPYAGPAEFGWPARNIAGAKFLQTAVHNEFQQVREFYERAIERVAQMLSTNNQE